MALALQISKPEGLPYKLFIAFTIEYPLPLWERARVRGKSVFRTKTYSRNCQTLGVPQQSWGFTHYYYNEN